MNEQEQQILAQLKDIHPPPDVAAWPLAWGWWVLIIVAVVSITGFAIWWRRHRQFHAARRQAQQAVREISVSHTDWPSQINQILKRTALAYFPAETMSGLYGQRWTQFMIGQLKGGSKSAVASRLGQLQNMLYQPAKPDPGSFETCQKAALEWLGKANFRQVADAAGQFDSGARHG